MKFRRITLALGLAFAGLASLGAAPAAADPVLDLEIHHNQTNFPPGGSAEYWFDLANVGDEATSGPITITVKLPAGSLSRESVRNNATIWNTWSCSGSAGDTTVVCTSEDSIPRHVARDASSLNLTAAVAPGASGDRILTATVAGGGAREAPPAASCPAGVADCAFERTHISPEEAGFGIVEGSFEMDFFEPDGMTPVRQAGSHPPLLTSAFDFNSVFAPTSLNPAQTAPAENIRNLHVDLPPGFVGAPTAVGECANAEFVLEICPITSQVGRVDFTTDPFLLHGASRRPWSAGVFNLSHPRGSVTDLAFQIFGNPIHVRASLDPANRYAVAIRTPDINETLFVFHQKFTVWGVPGDPSHDAERCSSQGELFITDEDCPIDGTPKPFLTVPSDCGVDNRMRLHSYDSWENSGVLGPDVLDEMPGRFAGCELPRFNPSVKATPSGTEANAPTGLDVSIRLPQNENPNALATPPVKSTVVTFPEGMTFNPAFADGLDGCTMAQFGIAADGTPNGAPVACPDNSRIGEVSIATPLLPEPVVGSMYLAKPLDNPCGTNFALYMAVADTEERGVLVKIPGCISLDPATGQITTSFDELPQFPFEDFTLSFRSGQRAPLVTPPDCGTQTIDIRVASYAQPDKPVDASNSFEIDEGPAGGPCPASLAARPFAPGLEAGAVNPVAGAFSPFNMRLTRSDADQELARFEAAPPPGVAARLAGVPFCPEAAIASIPTGLGTAKAELANPSCPAASLIGTANSGVGSGNNPNFFNGAVYLAGSYRGAPVSGVAVVPGIAGPYDLGNVVVRVPAYVDPTSAGVRIASDEIPKIVHGVLLRVRDVRVKLDRPGFTNNPTSCEEMSVNALLFGAGGDLFDPADDSAFATATRFQVLDCASLRFSPRLSFRLKGGIKRGAHPGLKAVVRMPNGANVARASVALPSSEFLDQSHIRTVCTRVQFAAGACPAGSIYGHVRAKTPLLDEVLRGPIYLRSSDNPLPDLVATFRGGRVDFDLAGRIDSVRGGIRNTFTFVPDVPVSWAVFSFQGGKKGLLVNSVNLCKGRTPRVNAKLRGHNGATKRLRPKLSAKCGKKGKRARAARGSHRRAVR